MFINLCNKYNVYKYLNEFEIEDTKVTDGLASAANYLKKIEKVDLELKNVKFNGKLIEFKKNETKFD